LVQRFLRTYGETLALSSHVRIYEALDSLRVRALIEEVKGPEPVSSSPKRRPKPNYRATELGVHSYEEWLLIQIDEERQRQRLFTRQLAMLEPHAALEVMDRYEEECLAEANDPEVAETERESVAHRLADQDEQLALEARLSWIRYARRELTALVDEDGGGGQRA
jgi:DNA-binding PadR family transcriptional regulator